MTTDNSAIELTCKLEKCDQTQKITLNTLSKAQIAISDSESEILY